MTGHERIKREIERTAQAIRAEMQALAEEFRRNIEPAVNDPGHPGAVRKTADELTATYERRIAACAQRLDAELARHFPDRACPSRGPYEEPRRRAQPRNRRLPKWPPDKRPSAGGVTVEPNRPNNLSGGAAAPLEFD
ncbi:MULTISPECIES: hypothetical protein [Sphingomonas]|uniref:hypothetical protein n=1 Tax=Sphingomonas TaxID=13687 RepID=UPI000DEF4E55|nr:MULTISPECIES: hypothetical protein [Sphingomonas]